MRRPLLLLVALLSSCGKGDPLPADLPGLLVDAKASRDRAEKARAGGEPKTAEKAAERAKEAHVVAQTLVKGQPTPSDQAHLAEIAAAARAARRFAQLAKEEKDLRERMSGLKAKAYRGGRKVALATTFQGLAFAADQEARKGSTLPEAHESAVLGVMIAEAFAGRPRPADDKPDWPAVAADLRKFADQLPPDKSTFLAGALMLSRQDGLALVEIESIDVKQFKDPEQRVFFHLLRGLILRLNGMPESAADAFLAAGAATTPEAAQSYGMELQAGVHLFIAADRMLQDDYAAADLEIVRAMKVWPNNPVAVFLTGERLGALGEREAAAKSLEAAAAGTDQEWLARKIADRARELRDGQGPAQPLIHDSGFLRDVALWHIWQAAKTSAPARRLQKMVETARGFASRWTPGGGAEK